MSSRDRTARDVETDGPDSSQPRDGQSHVSRSDGAVYPHTLESAVPDLFALELETNAGALSYLKRRILNGLVLAVGDAVALLLALLGATAVSLAWTGTGVPAAWTIYLLGLWYGGSLWTDLLPSWGLGPVVLTRRQVSVLAGVFPAAALLAQFDGSTASLTALQVVAGLVFSVVTVPLMRSGLKQMLQMSGLWGVPVVVYGSGQSARRVVESLQNHSELGFHPIGVFDDDAPSSDGRIAGVPVIGNTDLVSGKTAVAVVAMANNSRERMSRLLEGPLSHYRKVLVISDFFEIPPLQVKHKNMNGLQGLELTSSLRRPLARVGKRVLDLTITIAAAPLWVPLCGILTLLVWLEDRHFPFFLQERVGRNGEVFKTCKFRTMVPNAEEVLLERLSEDDELRREWEESYKLEDDPRVTRIGDFLRTSSLDELPQLYNVLRGDMSLVGPRPLPRYHHEELSSRVKNMRERVYPGITGLWQVSGRSDVGTRGMERWDPYYVQNWSVWLDLVILVRTIPVVIRGSGAY